MTAVANVVFDVKRGGKLVRHCSFDTLTLEEVGKVSKALTEIFSESGEPTLVLTGWDEVKV